jgi:hypothetical protein
MNLGPEYFIATLAQILLSVVAMLTSNQRFHAVFAVSMLTYQVSWAVRLFGTL